MGKVQLALQVRLAEAFSLAHGVVFQNYLVIFLIMILLIVLHLCFIWPLGPENVMNRFADKINCLPWLT